MSVDAVAADDGVEPVSPTLQPAMRQENQEARFRVSKLGTRFRVLSVLGYALARYRCSPCVDGWLCVR